jgi:hypothetical protein
MARVTEQYLLPALQGILEADKALNLCVEEALMDFCDTLTKKLKVSPHVLNTAVHEFMKDYKEPEPRGIVNCRGKTKTRGPCGFKPQWHGYCKIHEDQYTTKVRQADRMKKTAESSTIVHIGHNPWEGFHKGCPGCERAANEGRI